MAQVLLVTSSPRGAASHSSQIGRRLADQLTAGDSRTLVVRDLFRDPLPHIGADFVTALGTPAESRSEAQKAAIAVSDQLIAEVFAADVIVIASSMINFGVASTLKTYIDNLLRAGATFSYTAAGPEGLVKGKKAYLVEGFGWDLLGRADAALRFPGDLSKACPGDSSVSPTSRSSAWKASRTARRAAEKAVAGAAGRVSAVRPHALAAARA